MERFVKLMHVVALVMSALILPSYVSVILIVLLLALWRGYVLALIAGVFLDAVFGAPIPALYGSMYFYTMLSVLLIAITFILDRALLE